MSFVELACSPSSGYRSQPSLWLLRRLSCRVSATTGRQPAGWVVTLLRPLSKQYSLANSSSGRAAPSSKPGIRRKSGGLRGPGICGQLQIGPVGPNVILKCLPILKTFALVCNLRLKPCHFSAEFLGSPRRQSILPLRSPGVVGWRVALRALSSEMARC